MTSEERWRCFLLDAQDFLTSDLVDLMTPEERGGYIMLLCKAWLSKPPGYLRDDDAALAIWSRLGDRWPQCSQRIREAFEPCERQLNGRSVSFIKQGRLVHEHEKLVERKKQASRAGRASGVSRNGRKSCDDKGSDGVEQNEHQLNGRSMDVEQNGNSPFTLLNTPVHSSLKGGAGGFEEPIYASYPRRQGKGAAIKAIAAALSRGKEPAYLLERTQAYAAATAKWPKHERQFIPLPATWFNQERYEDDPATWERVAPSNCGNSPARIHKGGVDYDANNIKTS